MAICDKQIPMDAFLLKIVSKACKVYPWYNALIFYQIAV